MAPLSSKGTENRVVAAAVGAALWRPRNAVVVSTAALMIASPTAFAQTAENTSGTAPQSAGLQEVIVTAQRRSQDLLDVPYNISAIGGSNIANSGATTINDLSRVVAGLITVDQGPAARLSDNDLTLRGLRVDAPGGGQTPQFIPHATVNTVSTYFGETPIFFPMVLEDINRVEVLRGPQGTLYGSGAEAGTIRVIPNRPDFSRLSGELSATGSYTDYAHQPNSNVRGVLNLPWSDTLALRVVAGYEHLAGFINAVDVWEVDAGGVPIPRIPGDLSSGPVIGPKRRGVNSSNQAFARASLRWAPSGAVDVEFDYQHQRTTQAEPQVSSPNWSGGCLDFSLADPAHANCASKSSSYVNAGGPYTSADFILEPYEDTVDLASMVATINFGFATLTSATSYDEDRSLNNGNGISTIINPGGFNFNFYPPYYGYPRANFIESTPVTDKSFVQELRLASSGNSRVDYVVGVFYQREPRVFDLNVQDHGVSAYTSFIQQPVSPYGDLVETEVVNTVSTDKALFGEVTAHLTTEFEVTAGLRSYRDSYVLDSVTKLPLCGAPCSTDLTDPTGLSMVTSSQEFSGHLKKLNASYVFGTSTRLYATYSEGFRRGGANNLPLAGPFASLPEYQSFTPDSAKNYEIGIKGSLLENHFRYSSAIYRIDLTNFQFNSYSGSAFPTTFNGSSARSQGVEFELQAAVTDALMASLGYTYTDAKTTAPVTLIDLVPYALIPEFGGTGPTDTAPIVTISSGKRLPGVPSSAANVAVDYRIPLAPRNRAAWTMLLHLDAVYRSWAPGNIDDASRFYWKVPPGVVVNARAALDIGNRLGLDLFVNNVTSNTAYSGSSGVTTIPNPYQFFNVTRPRTVGLTVRYKF